MRGTLPSIHYRFAVPVMRFTARPIKRDANFIRKLNRKRRTILRMMILMAFTSALLWGCLTIPEKTRNLNLAFVLVFSMRKGTGSYPVFSRTNKPTMKVKIHRI
ncbi:hypothetical protein EBO34_16540 [Alteribacter keqinensis]|uniref:Uncharacterized protein n=1 Tax=Alteribacter keqinensis TaxID=2483800 RepID=A0A3M7TNJ4_9BACI|nr:hypothetical protein EBO34_16540 [Alteribacter keqinensis]